MINFLQQFIYSKLNNPEINNQITGIYNHVPNNTVFPYIYIGNFTSKDIGTKDAQLEEILFHLVIYSRDKSLKKMMHLSREITYLLQIDGETPLISMKRIERDVTLQKDNQTIAIMCKFKAIIAST